MTSIHEITERRAPVKADVVYFKNLNGLRAIAALLVVFQHVDLIKKKLGLPVQTKSSIFNFPIGSLSVTFFFVLSGFLITFLLLKEEHQNHTIQVKKFYVRRILKIWPLYFLLTLIGFTYLFYSKGFDGIIPSLLCYAFILPNFATTSNPLCFQSWSIGVEEQFYLIWPLIVSKKNILVLSLTIIILFFILRTIPEVYHICKINCPSILIKIKDFVVENRFDSMAIGGILAYLQFNKLIKYRFSAVQKYFFYGVLVLFFLISNKLYFGTQHFIFSILFAIFIYFQIIDERGNIFLESKVMKYLGKISYGIYMWHVVAIFLSLGLCKYLMTDINYLSPGFNLVLYTLSVVFTIVISIISFEFYESYFLKFKRKFYKV